MVEQDCPYPDLDGRDLEETTRHVVLLEATTWSAACASSTTADGRGSDGSPWRGPHAVAAWPPC